MIQLLLQNGRREGARVDDEKPRARIVLGQGREGQAAVRGAAGGASEEGE